MQWKLAWINDSKCIDHRWPTNVRKWTKDRNRKIDVKSRNASEKRAIKNGQAAHTEPPLNDSQIKSRIDLANASSGKLEQVIYVWDWLTWNFKQRSKKAKWTAWGITEIKRQQHQKN